MNIINKILSRLPLKNIVIFESNPDFSDNTYWLFRYLAENTDFFSTFKAIWFVAGEDKNRNELCGVPIKCIDNIKLDFISRLRRLYYTWFARIIFDCNRCIHKRRDNQYRIYLTHGMPFKNPVSYIKSVGKVDFVPVAGDGYIGYYSKYLDCNNIAFVGSPRNDIIINNRNKKEPYIIWMPTFRQHKNMSSNAIKAEFPLGIPVLKSNGEVKRLDEFLTAVGYKIMFRPHPAQDLSVLHLSKCENIIIANDSYLKENTTDLYTFISKSSALITDYSSVYIDYLLSHRPIALTLEDINDYSKQWPIYYEDIDELPGERLENIDDLINFIKDVAIGKDNYDEDRMQFMAKWGIKDIEASKTIYENIIKPVCE